MGRLPVIETGRLIMLDSKESDDEVRDTALVPPLLLALPATKGEQSANIQAQAVFHQGTSYDAPVSDVAKDPMPTVAIAPVLALVAIEVRLSDLTCAGHDGVTVEEVVA
ncbi:hypothetical protein ABZP36_017203 [Zizania latifolia]